MSQSQSQFLYNHSLVGSYPEAELDQIPGIWQYGSRALCCTDPNDLVQLDPRLKAEFPFIQAHYEKVGIRHSANVIWNESYSVFSQYPDREIVPFVFSELHHAERPDEPWAMAVGLLNQKNAFISLCKRNGWPIPNTQIFGCPSEFRMSDLRLSFPLYLKLSCSASGVGVFPCLSQEELTGKLNVIPRGVPFQIQEAVENAIFPNVQYEVRDGVSHRVICTTQVLDGFAHGGNIFPASVPNEHAIWDVCDPVAEAVAKMGFKGPFAFDVAVTPDWKVLLVECNPRFNACTYFSKAAKKLGSTCWMSRNVNVKARSLADLDLGNLVWDASRGSGLTIVTWGPIILGKMAVLFAGSTCDECVDMHQEFADRNK